MCNLLIGILGFVLFILYDWNSVRLRNRWLHKTFIVGSFLLVIATALEIASGWRASAFGVREAVFLSAALGAFSLLIYTLFFALPFEKTYVQQDGHPQVYDKGMYALCRHPGVIWFFLFYLALGLAFRGTALLRNGLIYSLCNLLYVKMQDIWTFPQTFADYTEYQGSTPFLLPTRASIRRAFRR